MSTFIVSRWFEIEADSIEEAYELAQSIGDAVVACDELMCYDHGEISVEETEE